MKWFSNIKIRSKMVIGFGAVILLSIFMAVYAIVQINGVNNDYQQLLNGAVERRGAALRTQSNIRAMRRTLTQTGMMAPTANETSINNLYNEMRGFHESALAALADYDYSVNNDPQFSQADRIYRTNVSNEIRALLDRYIYELAVPARTYALAGDHNGIMALAGGGGHIINTLIESSDYLREMADAALVYNSNAAVASANSSVVFLIAIALTIVLIAVVLALFVARSISKPVNDLVSLARHVSDGQLNINIDRSKITNDEIGTLTQYFYSLVDVVRSMVHDVAELQHQFLVVGDIEFRVDESKYQNSFKELMQNTNAVTDDLIQNMLVVLGLLKQISDGDFNITVEDMPGKRMLLPQTVREVVKSLKSVSSEIEAMIESTSVKGDLSARIDTSNYSGDWQKIMVGLNDITQAVSAPLDVIVFSLKEMEKGNFDLKEVDRLAELAGHSANAENYRGVFKEAILAFDSTINEVSSYITEVSEVLAKMSEGNLQVRINRKYVGDFVEIRDSINNICSSLNNTMKEISTAAEQVLSGATLISTSATDLSQGAQEQASSVQELNATIALITEQTRQNVANAISANELSNKSTTNAGEGNKAMKHMVEAMTQIRESSNNIAGIVKTIQDIAFQTNLLALNASVEAARAGEHGRGFAVVAEEVRNLAGRSQQAATETTTLIQDSIDRVESGSGIAKETAESLNAIVTSANEVLTIIGNISDASKEQAEGITQISDGLAQIANVTQTNSAVSQETAAASEELNSQAEMLRQLVSFFKL